MRSSAVAVIVVIGLALVLGVALLVVQVAGLRGDLGAAREEITNLRAEVDTMERGVPISELAMRLGELENNVREWVVAFSSDVEGASSGGSPGGLSAATAGEILDRLDEVLEEIENLRDRLDEICEDLPVC